LVHLWLSGFERGFLGQKNGVGTRPTSFSLIRRQKLIES
jgi:hypothetical protein